ncbi:MAG: hypothetical protein K9M98_08580 [Cephaloticoccus sp.]|nr:hypothetical protein [Cephaloticoccus sp.]MCF7760545.1 hypothetical protein [Cephaloticoccus sp.]
MKSTDSPKSLQNTLTNWQVNPTREPAFRGLVWQKIAERRDDAAWIGFLRTHAIPAGGLLALALVVGAWSGHWQARAQAQEQRDALVTDYVHSLDARAMLVQR